jgi:drug/metabolite transporter (DMT)-like permease
MKDRTKGLLVMLSGVLVISPDAVLTRFLGEGGADPWTIIFWKMLFALPLSTGFAIFYAGGVSKLKESVVEARYYYPIIVPLQACVDMCFTLAFVYTSAANALLLINLNPLWCAIAGRLLLGDILPTRTYIALFLSLCCILIIFVPEVVERAKSGPEAETMEAEAEESMALGQAAPLGNIIAFFTGLGLAAYITIVRHGGVRERPVNLIGSTAFAVALALIVSLAVRKGDVLPESYWTGAPWQFWLASIGQGISLGSIFIAITIAPSLITGAEVGLCVLLEAILGPLFVYFAYGDIPSVWTIIGGSLLLTVLAVHESLPLFQKAKRSISRLTRKMSSRTTSRLVAELDDERDNNKANNDDKAKNGNRDESDLDLEEEPSTKVDESKNGPQ